MSLYQNMFFRLADTLRGRQTISRLNSLRRSQHWSPEQLAGWQLERLNELLAHARANSPFHSKRLGGVTKPFTELSQIEQLPILTKDEIRANLEDIKARNIAAGRFILSDTGGSTGEPMPLYWDKRGRDWNRASVYRSSEWAGVALGEKAVQMSGSHFHQTGQQQLKTRIVHFLQRYKDLPVAAVSPELLTEYWRQIIRFRPTSIWGYPSALDMLARHIEERGPRPDPAFVRAIITSSETLTDEARARINRVFGGEKVFDNYGSSEFYLGAECRAHDGYHLHSEVLLIEIVGPDNRTLSPGEMGRVLVTDLTNHAFPFIRYEIGDIGVLADYRQCLCGVTLPKLQKVEGRISDVVVLRDKVLTAPNLTVFFHRPGVKAFQVRQEALDKVKVIVVPDDHGYTPDLVDYFMGGIVDLVGTSAHVELVERDAIEVPVSGKRRFVVSDVAAAHFRGNSQL